LSLVKTAEIPEAPGPEASIAKKKVNTLIASEYLRQSQRQGRRGRSDPEGCQKR
jgi:hypothetical protein